jgi:hypothetical protein
MTDMMVKMIKDEKDFIKREVVFKSELHTSLTSLQAVLEKSAA